MNKKRGLLIEKSRKLKNITIQELAEKLNIKEELLKKWEDGFDCPNASMIQKLAKELDIKEVDIINGENSYRNKSEITNFIKEIKWKEITCYIITIALIIGSAISLLIDYLIFKSFTWSLLILSSSVFVFSLILIIYLTKRKFIRNLLLTISILILPFIYIISRILNVSEIFKIGSMNAVISILEFWLIYGIFIKFKSRKYFASGLAVLVFIPTVIISNFSISYFIPWISFPLINVLINIIFLIAISIVLFVFDLKKIENSNVLKLFKYQIN